MRFTFVLIFMLVFAVTQITNPFVWASDKASNEKTRNLMDKLLEHMDALKPYIVSEEKFVDKKNAQEIENHLKELTKLSKLAAHDIQLQNSGYRISQRVLEDHIAETERVFRIGNKHFARWMMNSTLSICMSCHTQIPTASRNMKTFESLETYVSKFDQAEFLFATRAFDKAKDMFDELIINYPSANLKSDQAETAIERVITYYARIKRDPEQAISALKRYEKNDNLPKFLKGDIVEWIKSFKGWKNEPVKEFTTDQQILDFASQNLDPKNSGYLMSTDNPRAALYLKVSGILYEYLQKHPNTNAAPDLLYWLAICDKGLSNNFFYSLGDIYLRECIVRYPQSKIAKKCYSEYELETVVSYSGSSGVHVPDEVWSDLKRLKALIASPPQQGPKH